MKRLALFAHDDALNEVKPYVSFLLRSLREHCQEIVFVSISKLPEPSLEQVRLYCRQAILQENTGYDFGMWRRALSNVDLDAWDEIALVNSSVMGPIRSLGSVFETMSNRPFDFWGMTDSFEFGWHLQSYFLVLRRTVLRSPHLRRFFETVLPYRDKGQVIRSYEIGLTVFLQECGLRAGAFVPFASWVKSAKQAESLQRRAENPTLHYPLELLDAGMPFVKTQLLRDNPAGLRLAPVRKIMRDNGYPISLIPPSL